MVLFGLSGASPDDAVECAVVVEASYEVPSSINPNASESVPQSQIPKLESLPASH
jgi:hypothetical protein